MEYSYENLGNPAYLEFLVQRFNSNPGHEYYNLCQQDIDVLEPSVVRQLGLVVGSNISALPYSPSMQVALLELIRHAADPRPRNQDVAITLRGQTGPHPHEINEEDIEALQEMVDEALRAGFFAAAAAADDGGGGGAAAAAAQERQREQLRQLQLQFLDPDDDAPAPVFAGAGAAGADVIHVMPPHIAREALNCAGGECTMSHEDLATMSRADKAITSCGHVFNKDWIEQWLTNHTTCPTCRKECTLNPLHKADVRGESTMVPPHMRGVAIDRAIRKGRIPPVGPAYICTQCGYVTNAIPNPNQCPRCKKYNAFGGSRKCKRNKKNSRRKSKKSIKRNKTIKRR
jgi:predicted Zn-ribbon and HTH transcriptional regulator